MKTKVGKPRYIPFGEKVREILERLVPQAQQKNKDYIFCTRTGGPQTPDNLNRRFRNLLKSLEKKGLIEDQAKISIHSLRRTFISYMMMAGNDPAKVMAIVGHEDWQTMKRYLHLHPDYLKDRKPLPY